ncbi:MAG TPA: hypothetical protein VJA27_02025, partial [Patescibacteria group bacterium]|nr:hypothetical protein [Patescibacteria group bacterium]
METTLFKGLIGQERWQKYFAEVLARQKMSHAYLFSGPEHLGKRTFVGAVVRSLLCASPATSGVPCTHCASCRAWRGEAHPELVELKLKLEATSVGVEEVRGFIQALVSTPSLGKYRVGVLRDVNQITLEGLSVLLKTIEEPAQSVVLLLVADRLHPLPATVQSRLQHCVFTPMKRAALAVA